MQWPFRGHQPKMRPDGVRPGGPKRRKYLDDFKCGEDGEYHYILYLRPWGVLWDDVAANGEDMSLPYYYDIYKSYIEAGLPLPENVRELAGETD